MSSGSPVTALSVAPIAPTAAALRVEILGAAEAELIAVLGATQDLGAGPTPGPSAAPASPDPAKLAVDGAKATAAGQQASLAPLFADLAQALTAPALPTGIKAAIGQVLALQLPTEGPIGPEDVRQAVAQSGLFLEAGLAAVRPGDPPPTDLKATLLTLQRVLPAPPPQAAAPPTQPAAPVQQATPPAGPAGPPPQEPTAAAAAAAPAAGAGVPPPPQVQPSQANPAAPAAPVADLPKASTRPPPLEIKTPAAGPAPAPQTAASSPVSAQDARPAPAPQPQPAPEARPAGIALGALPPPDPKAALLTLQQAAPEALPARLRAEPPPLDPYAEVPILPQDALEPLAATASAPRPAPPARGAALSPQGAAPATLSAGGELSALIQHLRPQVEQALARLTLHQLASLPDGAAATWMFELPVATPQGVAVAQFEVQRDPPDPDSDPTTGAGPAPWRARFSIHIEPLGPVHVHLAMNGGKAAVSVWADRAGSLERLRAEGGDLARALSAEVVFRRGFPGGEAPARGHFLDRTS